MVFGTYCSQDAILPERSDAIPYVFYRKHASGLNTINSWLWIVSEDGWIESRPKFWATLLSSQ